VGRRQEKGLLRPLADYFVVGRSQKCGYIMLSDAECFFRTRVASWTHLIDNNFYCPAQQVCLTLILNRE
jgi:hypothetical protein